MLQQFIQMSRERFELSTYGLEDRCSIQLSYRDIKTQQKTLYRIIDMVSISFLNELKIL